jgi:hypothetical protein
VATTISNPASFSSVRTAFNTEGYGISTSFFAYRQGAGIVPATATFNAIGAGTGGDPLQLSQFSGFTVPSPGAIMTTGSNSILVSGGKGTAGYSLFSHGFSPGSTVSGNYVDYDSFYSLSYPSFGSISGTFGGAAPIEVVWHGFSSEDAQTGYFEFKLRIVVSGNIGGSLIPYVNGVAIAGAKAGVYNGSSQTVFTWLNGTRPNSGQTPIPGSDASTPNSNPFGANGTTPTINLS